MAGVPLGFYLEFIYNQLFGRLPYPTSSFESQTVIVTGSNVGLGFEAARHFTRLGAGRVILAVRNPDKGAAAKKSIETSTKCDPSVVEVWPLDLSRYESVIAFAERATTELDRLDVLVENAGIVTPKHELFEGHESTLTVNVLSTFLLGLLLLPKLQQTAQKFPQTTTKPHLVIVSSEVHFFTPFAEQSSPDGQILTTLSDKAKANMADRYNISKLLEVFFTRELASRTTRTETAADSRPDVIINFLNPGLCHSELARNAGWELYIAKALLARTTEAGSRTLVHAAAAGEESHGMYLSNCRVSPVAPLVARDGEVGGPLQTRVWDEIINVLEKVRPGVVKGAGL